MTVGCGGPRCRPADTAALVSGPHTSAGSPTNQTLPLGSLAHDHVVVGQGEERTKVERKGDGEGKE